MRFTKEEMYAMEETKQKSRKTADMLVMDELLEMGFSYGKIGTHYLHDSIVISTKFHTEDFNDINEFCHRIGKMVCKKYNVGMYQYSANIERSIESAFENGNTNYLINTFKGSYNKERMKVTKNVFVMTVRRKIMESLKEQDFQNITQLRLIIQGSLEGITDYELLKGICDIVLFAGNKNFA